MTDLKLVLDLSENWTMLDPRDIRTQVQLAVEAEKAGFDSVMVSEHIVMGDGADANGAPFNVREFVRPGNQDPATPWPSNTVLMSAIAATTSRVRIIGAALIAPLRHPVMLAKELATLDLLSEGRLVILPNVSWHKSEYDALGVSFENRGRILDEQLDILQTIWRGAGSAVSYQGKFFNFENIWFEPSAWRPTGPTIWIGGGVHQRMLNRLVKYGSGYMGMGPTKPEDRARIDKALTDAGRDPATIEFTGAISGRFDSPDSTASLDAALEMLEPKLEAGLRTFLVKPSQYISDFSEFPAFADEIITKSRDIATKAGAI